MPRERKTSFEEISTPESRKGSSGTPVKEPVAPLEEDEIRGFIKDEIRNSLMGEGDSRRTPTLARSRSGSIFAAGSADVSGAAEEEIMLALNAGDIICLRLTENNKGLRNIGMVQADIRLNSLGVITTESPEEEDADEITTETDFSLCAFRLYSKLNYRAQADADAVTDAIKKEADTVEIVASIGAGRPGGPMQRSSTVNEGDDEEEEEEDPEELSKEKAEQDKERREYQLKLARDRVESEKRQNRDTMEKIMRGDGDALKYGDYVQASSPLPWSQQAPLPSPSTTHILPS